MIRRFRVALGLLTVGFAAVLTRLAYLQIWCHADLTAPRGPTSPPLGAGGAAPRRDRGPPRRAPWSNRWRARPATSTPPCWGTPHTAAARLGAALDLDPARLARAFQEARGSFLWVRRQLTPEQTSAVEKENLKGCRPCLGLPSVLPERGSGRSPARPRGRGRPGPFRLGARLRRRPFGPSPRAPRPAGRQGTPSRRGYARPRIRRRARLAVESRPHPPIHRRTRIGPRPCGVPGPRAGRW
jgi:hypothetical protein